MPDRARAKLALPPDTETPLTFRTDPAAVCTLRRDDEQILLLHADDNGSVTFHVRGPADAPPLELQLDSTGQDGERRSQTILLAVDPAAAASAAPAPQTPPASTRIGPLDAELLELGNRELVARGYPPRPLGDRGRAYSRWLENVSRSWTRVGSRIVERGDMRFGTEIVASPTLPLPPPGAILRSPTLPLPPPVSASMFNANSNSWSGAQFSRPTEQFMYVSATWNVPTVVPALVPGYSATAAWTGMTADKLYQSGSDSESYNLSFFGASWQFTNYWMWIEAYPDPSWLIPNIPISPGDEVQAIIFPAEADGNTVFADGDGGGLTAADNNVWFMVYNNTRGTSYWGTYTCPFFTGTTAEYIVERPEVNGSTVPLAAFVPFEMWALWYGDSAVGWRELFPSGSGIYDRGPTYINMLSSADGHLLDQAIPLPDRTGDGGQEILFIWLNAD